MQDLTPAKSSLEMLPFHFHWYGIFAFDLRRSCPYCSMALSLPLTHLNAKKMQKEQTSRSQIKISSILYRMFNRSFDGNGVFTRIAWYSLVSSWNSNEFCASACSDSPSCAACEALVSNEHDRFLTTGMFVYVRERLVENILGHFLAVSWIWIAHGMLIPAQSVTFDLDCLLPFTLAITYALSRVWRNAKAALKRLRHVEATVSCYTIQGITLQCIWCLMMLKTKATLVTVPCFRSKELPIEWKSWNCDEPPPPTRGGVGDKELQGPGAKVGWEGWGTSESGVA